jgi:inosine-uridine nucleoside N-ribohydrolase
MRNRRSSALNTIVLASLLSVVSAAALAAEKVIMDTDIGADADDGFAVALALESPEVDLLGITTVSRNGDAGAQDLHLLLEAADRNEVSIAIGAAGPAQMTKGLRDDPSFAAAAHTPALLLMADLLNRYPGEVTFIATGPLTNLAALLDQEPAAFRKLKRVTIAWGPIDAGTSSNARSADTLRSDYNIQSDPGSAEKILESGMQIDLIPSNTTVPLLDEVEVRELTLKPTPLAGVLGRFFRSRDGRAVNLVDSLAVAAVIDPRLCSFEYMALYVDWQGITQRVPQQPNVAVCSQVNADGLFRLFRERIH